MPLLKKTLNKVFILFFGLIIYLLALNVQADFKLTQLESLVDSGLLQIDADAQLALSSETHKALDSGVDLRIKFLIELMQSRNWVWDTSLKSWEMLFTLHFHQLSGQYILATPQTDNIQAFNTAEDALEEIASKLSFNLGYQKMLEDHQSIYVRAKIKLDTEFLPAPLKLFSLVFDDWNLDSGWKEWALKP